MRGPHGRLGRVTGPGIIRGASEWARRWTILDRLVRARPGASRLGPGLGWAGGTWRTAPILSVALLLAGGLLAPIAFAQFFPEREPTNAEIVFGCDPGPIEELHRTEPPIPPSPVARPDEPTRSAQLTIKTDTPGHVVAGAGFNMEHTLWSCPPFRRVLGRWILEPFQPEVARVDSGQLPFAPADLSADELNRQVYQSLMDDPKYRPSWAMLRLLNRENVKLLLGVWGGPPQFTDDGTRLGALQPEYTDAYVEYVTSVVDYLVRQQHIQIWTVTVANEPDGGDGTYIPPDLYVEVARKLGPQVAPYGVTLNGPDTASAGNALPYLDELENDPDALQYFGLISTHEYFDENQLSELVDRVGTLSTPLPVYVTEYTSFQFGALDRGEEATNEMGQMLDSLQTYASLMNSGADAALYWDAVDYYQAGHAAITRWGLLRGPEDAFEARDRYYGFLQILPYVQAGSEILQADLDGGDRLATLVVSGGSQRPGELLIAAINRGAPTDLLLNFEGPAPTTLEQYVTDPDQNYAHTGRVVVRNNTVLVSVPARSVTTLTVAPPPDENE
ncbi:MAG: hypothetical protein IT305_04600 [Chloroflexi bacterium]|nr:hypothetical protein [Chloroflexota bacterium]